MVALATNILGLSFDGAVRLSLGTFVAIRCRNALSGVSFVIKLRSFVSTPVVSLSSLSQSTSTFDLDSRPSNHS
jgi:hypothetical protein